MHAEEGRTFRCGVDLRVKEDQEAERSQALMETLRRAMDVGAAGRSLSCLAFMHWEAPASVELKSRHLFHIRGARRDGCARPA